MQSPVPRLLAVVGAGLALSAVAATACSSADDISTSSATPTSSPPGTTVPPPTPRAPATSPTRTSPPPPSSSAPVTTWPVPPRPQVGNCYAVGPRAFASHRDGSTPVRCAGTHSAETFAVSFGRTLPDAARIHRIHRLCAARFQVYVGGPTTVSRLGMTLMEPSAAQVAAGERWIRCDAIETPSFNIAVGVPRRGSLRGAIEGRVPVAFRGCSDHWPKVYQAVHFTSCGRRHQAELIPEAKSLGGPDAPYPGQDRARRASRTFCAAVFQRYVTSTTHFYYYYPTPRSWASGPHTTTCWAVDPTGAGLPAL